MSEPRRQDYASDSDFIDAMAKYYGIDPRMCHQFSDADYLRVENTLLKVELDKLRMERIHDINQIGGLQEENAQLKANVEKWKAEPERLIFIINEAYLRIERITKAGNNFSDAVDRFATFANEDSRLMTRIASLSFKEAINTDRKGGNS